MASDSSNGTTTVETLVVNTFDDAGVKSVLDSIAKARSAGQGVLPVYINTYGGSVYHLLSMCSLLLGSGLEVHTIVPGCAMSAGAILFGIGDRRFLSPIGHLMYHRVWGFNVGTVKDQEVLLKQLRRLQKQTFELVDVNIGKKKGWLQKSLEERTTDWYVSPTVAKSCGFATDIGLPWYSVNKETTFCWETE